MADGETKGTGGSTLHDAARVYEGLLSAERNPTPRETPQPPEQEAEPDETDTSAEPVESEEGETAETEEVDDDGEGEEAKPEEPQLYTVKVSGEEQKVTLDELLQGYSRTADYTRKTQAHADAVKKFEAEQKPALVAERQQYAKGLQQIEQALQELTPQEPDWDQLRIEDPQGFPIAWAEWQRHQQRLSHIRAERERAEQKVLQDQNEAFERHMETEQTRLVDAVPEWKDPDKRKTEMDSLYSWAQETYGFKAEELDGVTDHRAILMLREAKAHRDAQKKLAEAKGKIRETVETTKPGAAKPHASKTTELTRRRQRLAKTGRVDDAAAAYAVMLANEKD